MRVVPIRQRGRLAYLDGCAIADDVACQPFSCHVRQFVDQRFGETAGGPQRYLVGIFLGSQVNLTAFSTKALPDPVRYGL